MVKNEEYKDFTFVWGFKEPKNYKWLEKNGNTVIVQFMSKEYQKYLAKAKYWFFNFRTAEHHKPKKDQVYVQCWHGTPLKKLGYDVEPKWNEDRADKPADCLLPKHPKVEKKVETVVEDVQEEVKETVPVAVEEVVAAEPVVTEEVVKPKRGRKPKVKNEE